MPEAVLHEWSGSYLAVAVTAVVFIAWFGAMERLGVDRTGLFNGLIPVASLGGAALVGTGTITPLRFFGALAVLAGVILGLGRAPQVPSGTLNQADRGAKPSAGALVNESPARSRPHSYADAA